MYLNWSAELLLYTEYRYRGGLALIGVFISLAAAEGQGPQFVLPAALAGADELPGHCQFQPRGGNTTPLPALATWAR